METDMDIMQYGQPLDDDTIDRIMGDSKAVSIIQYLNWATLSKGELDELVPDNDYSLDLLLRSGVVVREGEFFNLDVVIQSSCFRSDRMDDIREALGSFPRSCIRSLGYQSAYIADSLVSLYFGNEPCWDCGSEELACRAGLIDSDGGITEKGRECAFSIFSQIADVFDVRPVNPTELYGRWSSKRVG